MKEWFEKIQQKIEADYEQASSQQKIKTIDSKKKKLAKSNSPKSEKAPAVKKLSANNSSTSDEKIRAHNETAAG